MGSTLEEAGSVSGCGPAAGYGFAVGEESGLWQLPAPILSQCVSLGKPHPLSGPQFSPLCSEG